jgi:hypothetical protein
LLAIGRMATTARHFTTLMQFAVAAFVLLPHVVNLSIVVALWRSSSIAAYFDRENAMAALNLST